MVITNRAQMDIAYSHCCGILRNELKFAEQNLADVHFLAESKLNQEVQQ